MDSILAGLDDEQRQAVLALNGPVCILAGAGTGKTRTITHRIAYGVANGVYDPHRTLALTFTARAASEMRTRLRDLGAHGVQARTFHAAALRQLQYFWPEAIGGAPHELVQNKIKLIIEAAHRLKMRTDRAIVRDLAGEIEWAKVSMLTPATYPSKATGRSMPAGWDIRAVSRLFQAYEDIKSDRNLIDYEDILLLMVGILESEPRIAAKIHDQYRVFVVDEYQDVSPLQQRLLNGWLGSRDDLCVVGDASQTIYSFTGATSNFLLDFRKTYPNATQVKLTRDYRSTPQIVSTANSVLAERSKQHRPSSPRWAEPLELVSQREPGPEPVFMECSDDETEAGWIAGEISKLVDDGVQPVDIAVLFRTNSQSALFEQHLASAGINYQVRGAERFFARQEIRDAMLQIRSSAKSDQETRGDAVVGRVKAVLSSLGYTDNPRQLAGATREKWESLNALVMMTQELVNARGEMCTLNTIVQELQERAENQNAPSVNGVTLASLHSAKGLEWDTVFLASVTEGLMPISYALDDPADIDEERRLFYVGITRAKTRLYFSWATARNSGSRPHRKPSRFMNTIRPRATAKPKPKRRTLIARGKSVRKCRVCGRTLQDAAERKIGRCADCPPAYNPEFLETLKQWRKKTAERESTPAFLVFTDATLIAIAESLPQTPRELREISGVGDVKLDKYGQALLDIIEISETAQSSSATPNS